MLETRYSALFELARLTDHALGTLLDALTIIDAQQLREFNIPLLYQSGVRYSHDGRDDPWRDALSTFAAMDGDCEDFACWRAAELQVRFGIQAWPCFVRKQLAGGKQMIHVFVRLPGGRFEDPSRILGMHVNG